MGKYRMSIDLNVLNHLGINLYSNISAVLSEAVANSYDADATEVDIDIKSENEVVISDNGSGMDENDINEKYLLVGYQRRGPLNNNILTPVFKRHVMGRKGIGKLSLMSIARKISVYTIKDDKQSSFEIDVNKIIEMINANKRDDYEPKEITPDSSLVRGTKIIIKNIRKNRTLTNVGKIKTDLARRFSIIGDNFTIRVNGSPITLNDRQYFKKVVQIFKYGNPPIDFDSGEDTFSDNLKIEKRDNTFSCGNKKYEFSGWIGYVDKSDQLKDGPISINKISVMTNGKLGQEDILKELHNTSMFTNYIIGEIQADFLDSEKDLSTSNREGFQKDTDEYQALFSFLSSEIKHIGSHWNDYKEKQGVKAAVSINPKIEKWFNSLQGGDKKYAEKLFGKINSLITDELQRKDFTKYGILAFEKMKLKKNLNALDSMDNKMLENLPILFQDVSDLEESLYYQIVSQRLDVINHFAKITEENEKEKIIQEYLYKNLWLLDPSWERPTSLESMEISLKKAFDTCVGLTKEELSSRLDLRFKNFAGKTIVVELKRYAREISVGELIDQVKKYHNAINKILKQREFGGTNNPNFEIIVIVGKPIGKASTPYEMENDAKSFIPYKTRIVYYDELINNARIAYSSYFREKEKLNPIIDIFNTIDDE